MIDAHETVRRAPNGVRNGAERSLAGIDHLRDLPPCVLEEMARRCRWVELVEGEILLSADEPVDRVFFLIRGELRFSLYTRFGKAVPLRGVTDGSFVAAPGLAQRLMLPYSIEAAKPSLVASIFAKTFMEFVERDRTLLRGLLNGLIERQLALVEQIVELTTLNVPARIQNEIVRLCREGTRPDGSAVIAPIPTHSELARRIGTQREAVSREMSYLQSVGVIRRTETEIVVPNVARLAELQTIERH